MEAITQKADEAEILMWNRVESDFHNAYLDCIEKDRLKEKQYKCILQVVDRWFNTSNETINNYFTWSNETRDRLEAIKGAFWLVVGKAKKKLKKAQPGVWERLSDSIIKLMPRLEDVVVDLSSGTFTINFKKGADRFDKSWNNDQSLSWFNDRMKEMSEIMDIYSVMVYDELFFAENQDFMNTGLGEARDLFLEFQGVMSELEYEDDSEFKETLEDFKSKLNELIPKEGFDDGGRNFTTNDSMLVCRCGGVINIVYDAKAFEEGLNKVQENLINFLKWIEKDLYEIIYGTDEWDCWQMGVSFVDGFNFVRYVLLTLGQTSQYDDYIKAEYKKVVQIGYGVEMSISIQAQSVLNKKEHNKKAVNNLLGASLGAIGIKIGTLFSIIASTVMVAIDPSDDNINSARASYSSASSNKAVSKIGDLVGIFYILKGFAGFLADINYESTADYVGEIKVDLNVGTHDITYTSNYDITGKEINDKPDCRMIMRMKTIDEYNNEILNLKTFDNTLKMDTTIVVDMEKIEKSKIKFTVDEEDFND